MSPNPAKSAIVFSRGSSAANSAQDFRMDSLAPLRPPHANLQDLKRDEKHPGTAQPPVPRRTWAFRRDYPPPTLPGQCDGMCAHLQRRSRPIAQPRRRAASGCRPRARQGPSQPPSTVAPGQSRSSWRSPQPSFPRGSIAHGRLPTPAPQSCPCCRQITERSDARNDHFCFTLYFMT